MAAWARMHDGVDMYMYKTACSGTTLIINADIFMCLSSDPTPPKFF